MSEGFYSRKTGEVWDEVIEDWEMGAEEDALDKARALTTQLDEALGIAERKIRRLLPLAARWPAVSEEQALAEADYFRREHEREPTDEERASAERFREFIKQARSNEGPENLHSWQAKAERYEATCTRLTRERDVANAKIAALNKVSDQLAQDRDEAESRAAEVEEQLMALVEAVALWEEGAAADGDPEVDMHRQAVNAILADLPAAAEHYGDTRPLKAQIAALTGQARLVLSETDMDNLEPVGFEFDRHIIKLEADIADLPVAAEAWEDRVRADERERCASACEALRDKTLSASVIRCLGVSPTTGGRDG